jgi:hypothetical protein
MSLNLLAVQDQITDKLKELPQDVYETTAPDDSKLRFDANGMILPYIVILFSDMYESPDSRGILSARYNTGTSYVDVLCVGPTQRSARQVADLVRDKLTGFIPEDAGELRFNGGTRYAGVDPRPNRYEAELSFVFPVNVVW